jgi:hypothetical protein
MAQPRQTEDAAADGEDLPPAPQYRGLKTAVVIMGIILVAGFILVFSTIIYRAVKLGDEPAGDARPKRGFDALEASLAPDARVSHMALDGDRLAVTVSAPGGSEIILFDIRRGQELGRIRLITR